MTNRRVPHLVYFGEQTVNRKRYVKIGITVDLERRMKQVQADLIFAVECTKPTAAQLEFALHKTFQPWRVPGSEWFAPNPSMWKLITDVLKLGYWPWDHKTIIRGANW